MEITIRGRDGQVPERLKEFASHKAERLSRFLSTITSVDMELYEDGSPKATGAHVAELTVSTSGPVFRAKGAASDPRASIDMAIDRIERRLKEFKRRRSGRPAHSRPRVQPADKEATAGSLISDLAGLGSNSDLPLEIAEGTSGGGDNDSN